jgi:hypothetical protein
MATTVDLERVITLVQPHADASREQGEGAIHEPLETLAGRLTPGEARILADEPAGSLHTSGGPQPFGVGVATERPPRP